MVLNLTIQAFYMINSWKIVFKALYYMYMCTSNLNWDKSQPKTIQELYISYVMSQVKNLELEAESSDFQFLANNWETAP